MFLVDVFIQTFRQFDEDGSGSIDAAEVSATHHTPHTTHHTRKIHLMHCLTLHPLFVFDTSLIFICCFYYQLSKALQYMGQGGSPSNVERVISLVDEDGSGEVEWPEFLAVSCHCWCWRSFAPYHECDRMCCVIFVPF